MRRSAGLISISIDIVHLGIDEHARERRVAPRVGIERALAHQPVHAGLGAQVAVRVVAVDLDRRALDARHFAGRFLEHLDLEALALAVAQVHAQQHRRPVLRLGAAGARLDVDEAVVRVHRIGEHAPEFEVGDACSRASRRRPRPRSASRRRPRRARARRARALSSQARVELRQRADDAFERASFLAELLRALRVVPDLRVFELALDFREARRLHIEVKDTSAARRRAILEVRERVRRSGSDVRLPWRWLFRTNCR